MSWTRMTGLTMLGLSLLLASPALAKGPQGPGDGSPPHGAAISGDAKGTKLTGAIAIGIIGAEQFGGNFTAGGTVFAVLRLRKGNDFHTFYSEVEATAEQLNDIPQVQELLLSELEQLFVPIFFGGPAEDFDVRVKALEEFGQVAKLDTACFRGALSESFFRLSDVTIAVDPL